MKIQIGAEREPKLLVNLTSRVVCLYGAAVSEGPVITIPSHGFLGLKEPHARDVVDARIINETAGETLHITMPRDPLFRQVTMSTQYSLRNQALLVDSRVAEYIIQHELYPSCSILVPGSEMMDLEGRRGVRQFILYRP